VEASVAHRGLALISFFLGNFCEARTHCEKALDICDPERDQEVRERFVDDTATLALSILAGTSWLLGEVERARQLIDAARQRATELGHVPSLAIAVLWWCVVEVWRGDHPAALKSAEALAVLGRESGMSFWRAIAEIREAFARGRLYDRSGGATELGRAIGAYADQGNRVDVPYYETLLAELEAETHGPAVALARIDEALARADHDEYGCTLSFMHRIRGDILRQLNPADPALAEGAYRMAMAIANKQKARSPNLQAALALAKLYKSMGRFTDAEAALAPALEGFSPTPELPEIAKAQVLLERLASGGEGALGSKNQ
jgi:tetratricopeptide (TPR) repeat protein